MERISSAFLPLKIRWFYFGLNWTWVACSAPRSDLTSQQAGRLNSGVEAAEFKSCSPPAQTCGFKSQTITSAGRLSSLRLLEVWLWGCKFHSTRCCYSDGRNSLTICFMSFILSRNAACRDWLCSFATRCSAPPTTTAASFFSALPHEGHTT